MSTSASSRSCGVAVRAGGGDQIDVDPVGLLPGDPQVAGAGVGVGDDADVAGHRDHHLTGAEAHVEVEDPLRRPVDVAEVDREPADAELVAVGGDRRGRGGPVLALADAALEVEVGGGGDSDADRQRERRHDQPPGAASKRRSRSARSRSATTAPATMKP